jgi:hypothetical protein
MNEHLLPILAVFSLFDVELTVNLTVNQTMQIQRWSDGSAHLENAAGVSYLPTDSTAGMAGTRWRSF